MLIQFQWVFACFKRLALYLAFPCLLTPFLLRWASATQTQNKAKRLLPNYPPKHELLLKCQSRRVLLKSTKGRKREEERLANHPAPLLVRVGTSGRRTEIPHRARRRFTELPANGFSLIHCFSLSCPERMTEFIATGNISPCFAVVSEHAVILQKHGPLPASEGNEPPALAHARDDSCMRKPSPPSQDQRFHPHNLQRGFILLGTSQ